jgi:hypothetical protein
MSQTHLQPETSFRHYKASHVLKSLATTPYDLTLRGICRKSVSNNTAHKQENLNSCMPLKGLTLMFCVH